MKLTELHIENFLGARSISLALAAPVQIFAGPNGAGKSSVRDAVALALTADLGRVSLKKEAPQLIHGSAEAALCRVCADGGDFSVSITAGGKITDSAKGREAPASLPYVLDGQRFAGLSATDRREFLSGLMGVSADPASIITDLEERGFDAQKLAAIKPMLRAGLPAAAESARAKALEAKGGWRAITGETYGSEKAKAWRATVTAFDAKALAAAERELQAAEAQVADAQQALGRASAEADARQQSTARLADLRETAAAAGRISTRLQRHEAELKSWSERLARLTDADLSQNALPCPDCGAMLVAKGGQLVHAEPLARASEDELGQLATVRGSVDLYAQAVANDQRDLNAAQHAAERIKEIEADLAKMDQADTSAAAQRLAAAKDAHVAAAHRAGSLRAAKAAAESAGQRTARAARLAADAAQWADIAEELGPNGISARILAETLGPINGRLAQSAENTGWALVAISAEMEITADGRAYRLLSESERWRADAMLAEAISRASGLRLLLLDRFDVLDLPGRTELLQWLHGLAEAGQIETALIFGTLKAPPTTLPPTFAVHWIEAGAVERLKEAA